MDDFRFFRQGKNREHNGYIWSRFLTQPKGENRQIGCVYPYVAPPYRERDFNYKRFIMLQTFLFLIGGVGIILAVIGVAGALYSAAPAAGAPVVAVETVSAVDDTGTVTVRTFRAKFKVSVVGSAFDHPVSLPITISIAEVTGYVHAVDTVFCPFAEYADIRFRCAVGIIDNVPCVSRCHEYISGTAAEIAHAASLASPAAVSRSG